VLRGAYSFDGAQYFLPEDGELAGEVKHWNGLRVADGHICHGISLYVAVRTALDFHSAVQCV
jgi:hypothetical protein